MDSALSAHYILLIRPQQALPLARILCQFFVFKYISKICGTLVALSDSHQEKGGKNCPNYTEGGVVWNLPCCVFHQDA